MAMDKKLEKIDENLFYLPSVREPVLSADVFLIRGEKYNYLFDVGASDEALEFLQQLDNRVAIISHFHADHSTNLRRIGFEKVYEGKLDDMVCIDDGVHLEISPITSCHCKGSLMLRFGVYLLVGDSLYSTTVQGRPAYNVQKLSCTIKELEKESALYVVQSHNPKPIPMTQAIGFLKEIYSKRDKNSPYIFVD